MHIKDNKILCSFIMEALPITWGMVTTCLPVVSCNKAPHEYDPAIHELITESSQQASGWVCIQPALHRCLDINPEQKATFSQRGK